MHKKLCFWLLGFALLQTGCGPMNTPQSSNQTGNNQTGGPIKPTGVTQLSNKNLFYVYTVLPTAPQGSTQSALQLGDNPYRIRFVHATNLHPPSSNAKVNFISSMPEMPEMGSETTPTILDADGFHLGNVFYSMPGKWEIKVTLEDGDLKDEYVVSAEL